MYNVLLKYAPTVYILFIECPYNVKIVYHFIEVAVDVCVNACVCVLVYMCACTCVCVGACFSIHYLSAKLCHRLLQVISLRWTLASGFSDCCDSLDTNCCVGVYAFVTKKRVWWWLSDLCNDSTVVTAYRGHNDNYANTWPLLIMIWHMSLYSSPLITL